MAKAGREATPIGGAGVLFALTLVALGVATFAEHGFIPVWSPIPKWAPWPAALPYLLGAAGLAAGAGLPWRATRALAARLALILFLACLLAFRLPPAILDPLTVGRWENVGEAAVYAAAAWTLYAGFGGTWDRRLGFAVGDAGLRIARGVFGLALIAFGFAHLAYLKQTASLVPHWLPGPEGWAKFTGWAYILAGAGVVTGLAGRLAAGLAAWQIFGFTALVWGPMIWAGSKSPDVWSEAWVSWTLTVGAWVVAASYRGARWWGEKAE